MFEINESQYTDNLTVFIIINEASTGKEISAILLSHIDADTLLMHSRTTDTPWRLYKGF